MSRSNKKESFGFSSGREESEVWLQLQQLMAQGAELDDETVSALDNRMQGFLFLQQHVQNRRARIEFARDPSNMTYLRDAAGGQNVWMVDDEFAEFVQQDDAITLACFGRSEQMQLHHLAFIAFKLTLDPHNDEFLATAYDVQITLRKSLDKDGPSQHWRLMKQAIAQSGHEGARSVWRTYVKLAQREGLLATSNTGPFETSGLKAVTLH